MSKINNYELKANINFNLVSFPCLELLNKNKCIYTMYTKNNQQKLNN